MSLRCARCSKGRGGRLLELVLGLLPGAVSGRRHWPRARYRSTWVNPFKLSHTVEARPLALHHMGEDIGARAVGRDHWQWRLHPNRWASVSAPLQNLRVCMDALEDGVGPVSAFCPRTLVQAQGLEADQRSEGRKRWREEGRGEKKTTMGQGLRQTLHWCLGPPVLSLDPSQSAGIPSVPVTHGCSLSPEAQQSPCPNPFFHQTNKGWARLPIQSDRLAVSCRGICSCQKN